MIGMCHFLNLGKASGDHISPLLFNLVVDVFTRMLSKAVDKGYILGFMGDVIPRGVVSLQYADDTLMFLSHDTRQACYLKWILVYFEKISWMKINYHKSDLTSINLDEDESNLYAQIFCYKLGQFPFTYLGVPLHYEKLRREDIQLIMDKIMKRIFGWNGKLMSYGARLTLLKACLASIHIYLMSIVKFSKWAIKAINSQMAKFFWDDANDKHRYHLSNVQSMCHKKDQGGLGDPRPYESEPLSFGFMGSEISGW
jgi:hypothetical protein